jgi:hypothetical protein
MDASLPATEVATSHDPAPELGPADIAGVVVHVHPSLDEYPSAPVASEAGDGMPPADGAGLLPDAVDVAPAAFAAGGALGVEYDVKPTDRQTGVLGVGALGDAAAAQLGARGAAASDEAQLGLVPDAVAAADFADALRVTVTADGAAPAF